MPNIVIQVGQPAKRSDIDLLSIRGFIDGSTVEKFDQTLQGLLNSGRYRVVVDLQGVDYISSAGWGVFVGEIGRIRRAQGDLVLSGLRDEVREVFTLLQFDSILKDYQDVDSAVREGFGSNGSRDASRR